MPELAVLVDDPTAHRTPSAAQLEQWNLTRRAGVHAQLAASEAKEAASAASKSLSEEAVRKRKEREEKRAAAARAKATAEGLDEGLFDPAVDTGRAPPRPATPLESSSVARTTDNTESTASLAPSAVYTVTVPASSPASLPWYNPDSSSTYTTIDAARAAGVWI